MSDDADHAELEFDLTWSGSPRDRHDPLQTFAMTVLAAHKQARLADGTVAISQVRIQEADDAGCATAITAHLTLQGPDVKLLNGAADAIQRQARERADRDGTSVEISGAGAR